MLSFKLTCAENKGDAWPLIVKAHQIGFGAITVNQAGKDRTDKVWHS
jgi:hypothetical protein